MTLDTALVFVIGILIGADLIMAWWIYTKDRKR